MNALLKRREERCNMDESMLKESVGFSECFPSRSAILPNDNPNGLVVVLDLPILPHSLVV